MKPRQGGPHGGGAGRFSILGPARGPQFAIERVCGAGTVHDDDGLFAHGERQAAPGERLAEFVRRGRWPGGGKNGAQIDGGDFGPLLDVAALR